MAISINTNIAATRASQYLASNHANLQKSLDRLSSGKRITSPSDDAGGLAVSMKLEHSINGLKGASKNISNGISLLQVQDGILESAGQIVARMGELRGMYDDVTKNTDDKATYDSEYRDLKQQLNALASTTFNDVNLFETSASQSKSVYITASGSSGTSVDISQHNFIADLDGQATATVVEAAPAATVTVSENTAADYTSVLEKIAEFRAANGGQAKRLEYAQADVDTQITNLTAANGRIMDVDIATESAALARHQILVQASASMVAQANSANNVALTLLQ